VNLRHRNDYPQILRYETILRLHIGVIPSIQATHATTIKKAQDRMAKFAIKGALPA